MFAFVIENLVILKYYHYYDNGQVEYKQDGQEYIHSLVHQIIR